MKESEVKEYAIELKKSGMSKTELKNNLRETLSEIGYSIETDKLDDFVNRIVKEVMHDKANAS